MCMSLTTVKSQITFCYCNYFSTIISHVEFTLQYATHLVPLSKQMFINRENNATLYINVFFQSILISLMVVSNEL